MALNLHYHPHSRAAGIVWALEELGLDYELTFVDFPSGANQRDAFRALNPMGKIPTLVETRDEQTVVVTEAAAIALYLGDRYGLGTLAPAPDDPARADYLRWSFYSPSVIEPGAMAQAAGWEFKAGSAGWGTYANMLDTIEAAIGDGPFLLGDRFTMADVVFGGTVRWMTAFGMLEKRPSFVRYVEALDARPAYQRSEAVHAEQREQHGL